MAEFVFRSARGEDVSPTRWVAIWSSRFDGAKFPEDVYQELVLKGSDLTSADFDVLGAWKDGAIAKSTPNRGLRFGNCWVKFNGRWSEGAAGCAYHVWKGLSQSRDSLVQYLVREEQRDFLVHLAGQCYRKASKGGSTGAAFGLSRATYVLHIFSGAKFPIYDSNTHRGVRALTQGRYDGQTIPKIKTKAPNWYLETFCRVVRDLQEACNATNATDASSRRAIVQALFCYGKAQK
jgi:hypothetical protein